MNLIAHRGLINGPNTNLENSIAQIAEALSLGFDVEVDVWMVNDMWYLGHDEPVYRIDQSFLNNPKLWIHAKNLNALFALHTTNYNYFWHQNDDYTLTSHGYIWTYPNKTLTTRSICVLPEWEDPSLHNIKNTNCYGVCSDYVALLI